MDGNVVGDNRQHQQNCLSFRWDSNENLFCIILYSLIALQVSPSRILQFRLDRSLYHNADQMASLYADLRRLSDQVGQTNEGYRRARLDTAPLKKLVLSLLRGFGEKGAMTELYRLAVLIDGSLFNKGFSQIMLRLDDILTLTMNLAGKDEQNFASIIQTFVIPVLVH